MPASIFSPNQAIALCCPIAFPLSVERRCPRGGGGGGRPLLQISHFQPTGKPLGRERESTGDGVHGGAGGERNQSHTHARTRTHTLTHTQTHTQRFPAPFIPQGASTAIFCAADNIRLLICGFFVPQGGDAIGHGALPMKTSTLTRVNDDEVGLH